MEDNMENVMMLSSGFSVLVGVLLDVALLVVALTVVRRYRRDVMKWIVAPAIIALIHGVSMPLLSAGTTAFVSRSYGVESIIATQAGITFVSSILHALGFGLLILGIVKLSRPQQLG